MQNPGGLARFSWVTLLRCSCLAGLLLLPCHAWAEVDFARDIQPLFAEHCLECHGPDKAKGGLLLTHREDAMKVLKSGERGIVPADAGHSAVVQRLLTDDADEHMPPKGKKPLKPEEIERIKTWIQEGAKFDLHWAYKPVANPPVPATNKGLHPVDAFVRARLKEAGLTPSPEAAPATLLKRASYDLLGLPPTPEDVDDFVADIQAAGGKPGTVPDTVWSKWLGKLLDSPHFGERWGRHWLDAARYADSDGYEKDRPRPDAWRYRDWVIQAVNDDLPFDQFTIEQLAGDLLPKATPDQVLATAFNRQTLTNTEGGTDQEQFRVEAVFDRTETLGAVWLGLTVGCARCHTHKYDQISHREYYQLFAFFNNGDEMTRQVAESPAKWSEYQRQNGAAASRLAQLQKELDQARSTIPSRLPAWEAEVQARLARVRAVPAAASFAARPGWKVKASSGTAYKAQPDGSKLATGKKVPKTEMLEIEVPADRPISAIQIQVLPDPSLPGSGPGRRANGNFVLSEVKAAGTTLHSASADFAQSSFEAAKVLDGDEQTGWAVGGGTGKEHTLTLQLSPTHPAGKPLKLTLVQNYAKQPEHVIGRFNILVSEPETEASIAPAEVVKLLNEEPRRRNPVLIKPLYDWLGKVDPIAAAAFNRYQEASAKLPKPPLMDVRVIGERTSSPRETHILHRGNFLDPAEPVVPATLAVLPPLKVDGKSKAGASRLEFARWLVSCDNPLTPRVTVNQVWLHLFGEGLVKTAADFGVRGERPTHPELLDYLSREFIAQGWSRKALLKRIMMSATYRQSSASTEGWNGSAAVARSAEELARIQRLDPKNDLLWRQNRMRVEGEIVRDLHLAASGLLSTKVGGPSVFPPMPPDVADLSYANNFKWTTSAGGDRYRRGMYTFFKRTAPYPDLTTFDCPDANTSNVKRTVSNTPLQALTTLNAEAFAEASRAMASRLLTESLADDRARLTRCLRLCLGRPAQERELSALSSLLRESRDWYKTRPEEAKAMTGTFGVKDVPAAETAAWAATARIVLNLDEFVTRD